MYSLEQLQQKNIKQLKEIGWQLNVMPEGDKRCRQNWIDALVGVNPLLLQLLEVSPVVFIQQVLEVIEPAAENSLGVDVDRVQQPIETVENSPGVERLTEFNRNNFSGVERVTESNRNNFSGVEVDRVQKAIEVQAQELIALAAENSSGVERALESIENLPSVNLAAKNLPGSRLKTSTAHQLLDLFKSSAHIIEDFPGVKTEVTVSESAIAPAVKTSFDAESDRHPILRGVTFSDRFLSCYSPPQSGIIHFQSELDGQLSLLDFEVQSEPEPPDPDDFESLDAFREAIARWDTENSELLAASIDSMCEWVPCPEEWYWPKAEILPLKPSSTSDQLLPLQQSSVIELSIAGESSITCNFFLPTFDAWCDRFNRSDEPPDTGIYARLPKSKPPSFPSTALGQAHTKRSSNPVQTHSKLIPNAYLLHCRWQ